MATVTAREKYSWYNLSVVAFAAAGSCFTGYSLAVFGYTLGQPTFYEALGLSADPTSPSYKHTSDIIGAANGIFFGLGFFGCFLAGWAGDKFGRVNGFRVAACIGIIGGVLECASQSVAMFLVARAIAGLASGHTMAAMPTYFAEVSPPHARGMITGAHGVGINIGYVFAGWIGFATFHAPETPFSWRFPFAIVILWALCLLGGTFYVPESPRWLIQRDEHEKALAILIRLHRDPSDDTNAFARQELRLIEERCMIEKEVVRVDGKWRLFTKKENLKRLGLAFMIMMGGQNIGTLVINNYNVLLYGSLGLDATVSLLLAAVYNTIGLIFACLGLVIADRIGRRKNMLIGYVALTVIFAVLTGMIGKYSYTPTKGWAAAAVVMIYMFVSTYCAFIDLNQFTIATEIFPTHIRNQASSVSISGLFLSVTLWLNLTPTATTNIGWRWYLVFNVLVVVHTVYLFFYLPETGGWTLEEMDAAMDGTVSKEQRDFKAPLEEDAERTEVVEKQ